MPKLGHNFVLYRLVKELYLYGLPINKIKQLLYLDFLSSFQGEVTEVVTIVALAIDRPAQLPPVQVHIL